MEKKYEIPVPSFVNPTDPDRQKKEDSGGFFPTKESAQNYADGVAKSDYHKDRLRALKHILSTIPDSSSLTTILDYGIGDGGIILQLGLQPQKVIGTDTSPHMVDLASQLLAGFAFQGYCGSVEVLADVATASVDLILCLDVLGYLSSNDQVIFFTECQRILKQGKYLIVMTGNELLDLFALNAGTAQFFEKNFLQEEAAILLTDGKAERFKNAERKNPLNFGDELAPYGFTEIAQSFSQWHKAIPALANRRFPGNMKEARLASRDHNFDPNQLPAIDKWKALFCCSIFASLSKKE